MSIFLIVGTRPQIIKSSPVINQAYKQGLDLKIIHTGQHYDYSLSEVFFEELTSPKFLINLKVGSGSHIFQIAEIMRRLEKHLAEQKPSCVLVPGDTNSALAAALATVKFGIPVAHLESGARSYDMKMAEEINRRLIDHSAQKLFVTTTNCRKNLENESVIGEIFQTGDTMYDIFLAFNDRKNKCKITKNLGIKEKEFAVLTMHRAENVDDPLKLKNILKAIESIEIPIFFPIHPRTKDKLTKNKISLEGTNIHLINPVSYVEMLSLLSYAKFVITDSGGLQKDAFWSKTPCITIRDRTEWTETVDIGVNFIAGTIGKNISSTINFVLNNLEEINTKFSTDNPYGDGNASEKIIDIIREL